MTWPAARVAPSASCKRETASVEVFIVFPYWPQCRSSTFCRQSGCRRIETGHTFQIHAGPAEQQGLHCYWVVPPRLELPDQHEVVGSGGRDANTVGPPRCCQ